MPQLPFDFTFNINESSANKVEKRIADIDKAVSNIGSSATGTKGLAVDESTIKSFERLGKATKRYANDQKQAVSSASSSILGYGNDVKKTSKVIGTDLSKGATVSARQVEELNEEMKELNETASKTRVGVGHTSSGLKNLEIDARNLNKSTANANQTLFAFSDLVQDSTQFTQGFSQGMRAIGNNVAFTAELFSNLKNRVDVYNESMRAIGASQEKMITVTGQLRKSLRGFGGVLITINAAFVVMQIFADRNRREMKKLEEQARATAEGLSEIASEFSSAMGGNVPDPFGMRARQVQLDLLTNQLKGFSEEQLKATLTSEAFAESSKKVEEATEAVSDIASQVPEGINKVGQAIRFMFGLDNTSVGRFLVDGVQEITRVTKEYDQVIDSIVESYDLPVFFGEMLKNSRGTTLSISDLNSELEDFDKIIGEKTVDSIQSLSSNLADFIQNPIDGILKSMPNLSFEAAKFFGLLEEQDIVEFEALRQLRIELEKTQAQQDAYNNLLNQEGFEGIKEYKDALDELAESTVLYNTELYLLNDGQDLYAGILKKQDKSMLNAIGRMKDLADEQLNIYLNTRLSNEERQRAYQVLQLVIPTLREYQEKEKAASDQLESTIFKYTVWSSTTEKLNAQRDVEIEKIKELREKFQDLGMSAEAAENAIRRFLKLQGASMVADDIAQLAGAAGSLGEVFNASKEFRVAMASIEGGAAIVSTLADPSNPSMLSKVALSAAIAARVAQQIKQIKQVTLGGGGSVGGGSSASLDSATRTPSTFLSFGQNQVTQPSGNTLPLATPSEASLRSQVPQVNVSLDRSGLTTAVSRGQREISSKQINA